MAGTPPGEPSREAPGPPVGGDARETHLITLAQDRLIECAGPQRWAPPVPAITPDWHRSTIWRLTLPPRLVTLDNLCIVWLGVRIRNQHHACTYKCS